jgi:pyrroline-5-carboxylate reductase
MSAMMVASGLMGGFYAILRNNRNWLMRHGGLSQADASVVIGRTYNSMTRDVMMRLNNTNEDTAWVLEELIQEQTPGGLNEQALANLSELGVMDAYDKVQSAMLDRIMGKTDGSLPL